MKKLALSAIAATVLCTSSAFAADLKPVLKAPAAVAAPSPWDWAVGGATMTDYNFRGISQSNKGPSGTIYQETRYNVNSNWQLYAGTQYWSVALPTNPSCECDLYAGIRPTLGPIAFDFGFIYYWYPRERQVFVDALGRGILFNNGTGIATLKDTDYYEGYGKATYEAMKDRLWLGANFYYSPDWLNTGAYGAYGSVTAKVAGPAVKVSLGPVTEVGWYVSGEFGHYWLGTTGPILGGINLPDYNTWNAGLALTWSVFTLDVRYYDTDLSRGECFTLTGDLHGLTSGGGVPGQSKWCGRTVIAAFKVDITGGQLK
jgi:uncharacterized protein (TIGR02001 family)